MRGQNVPIEPDDKVDRENRRIKALELQSAILSQLEDREKLKREERERKLREEKLEELRIQREQEQDRLRFEEERRKTEERQLLEQRKLETLKKALEDAERKARQEKEKRFNRHRQNINKNYNEVHTSVTTPRCDNTLKSYEINVNKDNISNTPKHISSEIPVQTSINNNIEQCQNIKGNPEQATDLNSPSSTGTGNLNFIFQNVPPLSLTENQYSIVPIGINGDMINNQQNSLQLAVLVPQNISHSLYSVSLNSLNTISESVQTSSRVLTPRKFRNTNCKDAFTQTDLNLTRCTVDKANETDNMNMDKDYHTVDDSTPHGTHHSTYKKDRRFRSEERYKKDLENRPKWGVNRPIAQYKKQSEKDPFYSQKRKIRQKHRPQPRQYLSQSSDDSRSPSPPLRSGKDDVKQRNSLSQSYWKNKRSSHEFIKLNNDLSRDFSLQVEYNQLDQVNANDFEPKSINNSMLLSPSKRMTLSQKFINDKYGNRKLWNDEIEIDKNFKSNSLDIENRKKIIEQLNIAKRDYVQQYGHQDNIVLKTNL